MADLITNSRAIQNSKLTALNTTNPTYLASLITTASNAIEKACKRTFASTSYREYLSGERYPFDSLKLKQFPVISVERVATTPKTVLRITNTTPSTNQRATVASSSTGLTLVRVASGSSSSSTLAFGTYVTVTALADAINALGNGWSAAADSGYTLFPSADIRPLQGAASAVSGSGVELEMCVEDLTSWRLDDAAGIIWGTFPRGRLNIQVDYTAGFATIPQQIQQACVALTQHLYELDSIDAGVISRSIGPYSQSFSADAGGMPPMVKDLIAPYVDHSALVENE